MNRTYDDGNGESALTQQLLEKSDEQQKEYMNAKPINFSHNVEGMLPASHQFATQGYGATPNSIISGGTASALNNLLLQKAVSTVGKQGGGD